jgi:hypothetical protein
MLCVSMVDSGFMEVFFYIGSILKLGNLLPTPNIEIANNNN